MVTDMIRKCFTWYCRQFSMVDIVGFCANITRKLLTILDPFTNALRSITCNSKQIQESVNNS